MSGIKWIKYVVQFKRISPGEKREKEKKKTKIFWDKYTSKIYQCSNI